MADKTLHKVRRRLQRVEQNIAHLRERQRQLIEEEAWGASPENRKLTEALKKQRYRLWQARLKVSRTRFSLRVQERRLAKTQTKLAGLEESVQREGTAIEALNRAIAEARARAVTQFMKSVSTQDAVPSGGRSGANLQK